jgi:putative membrane protein
MEPWINAKSFVGAIVYSALGLFVFMIGFWVWDRVTPYQLWKELIEQKNIALAIVVAGVTLGISIIVASAIH